jgi:gamma-D-glutamyl-L-lysine dipeptidyl-peptidase
MDYAVVAVPAAPVRRKARHQNEMVSQLLFGETVKIIKTKGSLWVKIRSMHDGYEGWMTNTMLKEIDETTAKIKSEYAGADLLNTILINDKKMHIPFGASLPGFSDGKGKLNDIEYSFAGNCIKRADMHPGADRVQQLTAPWLNAPYMWGGRTILGVDCSGFVQVNYKMMGIDLLRDAWQQVQQGTTVKKLKEAVCGDLAFFDDKDEIVHVGILLNNEQIIHASGRVRIDTIDKKGIISSDTGKRTHFLKSIKRYW